MKSKQSRGKGKRSGNRGIKDLPVSDAKAKDAKGGILGHAINDVVKKIGSALNTAARG
jgi:hypothetical protein